MNLYKAKISNDKKKLSFWIKYPIKSSEIMCKQSKLLYNI